LLICGARQTGKTYIVNEFGKLEFENIIDLNFERNPEYKEIFNTNLPKWLSTFISEKFLMLYREW
jgi:hypothetical protein